MSETGMGTTSSFISMLLAVSICVGILFPPYRTWTIIDVGKGWKAHRIGDHDPLPWLKRISGRRDSNSRHRPWEGRALPAELLPLGKPDFSIALPQFLAHRPDDPDQLSHPRRRHLHPGGVEDLHRVRLVEPNPAAVPGFEVDPLPKARLDHEQLTGESGGDPIVGSGTGLEGKTELQPAGVRVPPGFEMQPGVIIEPLRLAGADPVADILQSDGQGGRDRCRQRAG